MPLSPIQEYIHQEWKPDQILLQKCMDGDQKAQMKLYDGCYGMLMAMARAYYKNREDCTWHVNSAFMKILSNLKEFKGQGSFEGWCRIIMRRVLIDEWRKEKKFKGMFSDNEVTNISDLSEAVYNKAETELGEEEVREILFRLPEATRLIFNLFALEGYSHAEIAAQVHISEGTSRWHVNEARKKLKDLIENKLGNKGS